MYFILPGTMNSSYVKKCQLCTVKVPDLKHLLKHIRQVHAHKPGFRICCGLSGCPRLFRTFEVFRNHVYAIHTDCEAILTPTSSHEDYTSDSVEGDISDNSEDNPSEQSYFNLRKKAAAIWILKIQEVYKLPQSTMDKILADVTGFIQDLLTDLYDDVKSSLTKAGVNASLVAALSELFSSPYTNPFAGLRTQHTQLKFYTETFKFVVSFHISLTYTVY